MGLRVCPESSCCIEEFSEHEANGSEAQESKHFAIAVLPVLGEPAASIEPGDAALDDPALGENHKSVGAVGALDDFDVQIWPNVCQPGCKFRSLIGAVCDQKFQKWKLVEQGRQHHNAAITILNVGGMNLRMKQQA